MLLREFIVDNHTIELTQDGEMYITKVTNSGGEKVFYHEYTNYEKIKASFDEIVKNIEKGTTNIETIMEILGRSTL